MVVVLAGQSIALLLYSRSSHNTSSFVTDNENQDSIDVALVCAVAFDVVAAMVDCRRRRSTIWHLLLG